MQAIKRKGSDWAEHVTSVGEMRNASIILSGKLMG